MSIPCVKIDAGLLQGVTTSGIATFKGVPYAKPPLGEWRWRPPQRPAPWIGVRLADQFGAIAMQKIPGDSGVGVQLISEDCLTLNVFAPAGGGSPWPVMVWIHGGGLVNGSGSSLYDGPELAQKGVMVVTFNYRLGRFGFFAHPSLTAETPATYLANYGLMDQIAALHWVRRNIAAFGGDPDNVTLFGEEAGGLSVNRLMMIREAQGLFHKAIVQSGLGREQGLSLVEAEAAGAAFADGLGVGGGDPGVLREIQADAIVAAGDLELNKGEAPILDGRLLSENPIDAFGRGRTSKIPYLIGSNRLETIDASAVLSFQSLNRLTPSQTLETVRAYGSQSAYDAHIRTDLMFSEPARALARDHAISGHPTYLYRSSASAAAKPEALRRMAIHAKSQTRLHQSLSGSLRSTGGRGAAQDQAMSAYLAAFAKTGDPNGAADEAALPYWPAYNSKDQLLDFTNGGPEAKVVPDAAVLDLIGEIYRQSPASG